MCTYHFLKKKKSGMELWQWHCRIPFHFSQFQKLFFYPLFWQCHCHNCQKFIPSISAIPLRQTFFFPPIFGNGIATIAKKKFFHIWFSLHALTLRAPTRAAGMGRRNFGDGVAENQKSLSPTFYLSLISFC